jgi:L,D-peptidoglycan transpeptidase YkuD (ErfK/YbiS/YcfS/YnhG family)
VVLVSEQSDGTWASTVEAWGHVGSGGVGSASEYSSATPAGVWPLTAAFGSAGNPGSALPYRAITSASCYISDVNDPQYNTWQERSSCPAPNEHMADYPTQYAYGLVMGYNQSGTPGAGSAFFVHVDNGAATAGCVSVPTWMMVSLLQSIRPGGIDCQRDERSSARQYLEGTKPTQVIGHAHKQPSSRDSTRMLNLIALNNQQHPERLRQCPRRWRESSVAAH